MHLWRFAISKASNTFELVALLWLENTKDERAEGTLRKIFYWLRKDIVPVFGAMLIAEIRPRRSSPRWGISRIAVRWRWLITSSARL